MPLDAAPPPTRTTRPPGNGSAPAPSSDPPPGQVPARPQKLRRRPVLVAAAVAAASLGALLSAWAYTSTSNTQTVLAVRSPVYRGQPITTEDLVSVEVGIDPALQPVPASELDGVTGKRAVLDLSAGTLLTAADLTSTPLPPDGRSLVGVALTPATMPSTPLRPGDNVRVVTTPGEAGNAPTGDPETIPATVVAVRAVADTGQTVIDVTVPTATAPTLAARAATGKVALVLDSPAPER